jgi:hypothetical protein
MNTGMKANGLKAQSKAVDSLHEIDGTAENDTVELDFDKTPFKKVKSWALKTCEHFKLKGFDIYKTSENNYHVVFDLKVTWKQFAQAVAWVILQSHHVDLNKWFLMQCIKGTSTLRVSKKKEKPSPRLVYHYGSRKDRIPEFRRKREFIKRCRRKLAVSLGISF